jgi:hypothetical protein
MVMRKISFILLAGLLSVSFCRPPVDDTLIQYRPFFNEQFKGWSGTVRNLWLYEFHLKDSLAFNVLPYLDPKKDIRNFYSIYKPLLYFSEDKTQFVDIYSYGLNLQRKGDKIVANAEAEQGITLCDFKANKWQQILIFGDVWIQDVCWVTQTQFIMVGSTSDIASTDRLPIVYIGDVLKRKCYSYTSSNHSCIQAEDYKTPQYLAMHIQE